VVDLDRDRRKEGGDAGLQKGRRTEIHFESKEKLSGGRCAPGAMQREGIAWPRVLRQPGIPGDDLSRAGEIKPGGCQRRHVQRLADMASIVGALGVPMRQRRAKREVQQRATS